MVGGSGSVFWTGLLLQCSLSQEALGAPPSPPGTGAPGRESPGALARTDAEYVASCRRALSRGLRSAGAGGPKEGPPGAQVEGPGEEELVAEVERPRLLPARLDISSIRCSRHHNSCCILPKSLSSSLSVPASLLHPVPQFEHPYYIQSLSPSILITSSPYNPPVPASLLHLVLPSLSSSIIITFSSSKPKFQHPYYL